MALACHPSVWEVESGGSGVQGYPQLHGEFMASLSYMSPCQKRQYQSGEGEGRSGKSTVGRQEVSSELAQPHTKERLSAINPCPCLCLCLPVCGYDLAFVCFCFLQWAGLRGDTVILMSPVCLGLFYLPWLWRRASYGGW